MDRRFWTNPLSWLSKGKAIVVDGADTEAETPEHYLNVTRGCLERVHSVASSSIPRKFNREQCQYLEYKLDWAVRSASSVIEQTTTHFLSLTGHEEKEHCLAIFKLLSAMGLAVENFIQGCCNEAWVHSAVLFTNTADHVVSIASNLEFCTYVFSATGSRTLSHFDAAQTRQAEVEIVIAKADVDERQLIADLNLVLKSNASDSHAWHLASFVLDRLKAATVPPAAEVSRPPGSAFSHPIFSSFQTQDRLGSGACGSVFKGTWLGVEVAKKTFHGPNNRDFLQEVSILEGLSHPNVVSFLGYWSNASRCHLVMELMDFDLHALIEQRMGGVEDEGSPFSLPEALDLILQIGEGMLFLHGKRIVHSDLKSHNILVRVVKALKGTGTHVHVKVADFGFSKTKERSATYSSLTPNVGTTRWMAPEVIKIGLANGEYDHVGQGEGLKYPFKTDIYSFGMVCYEILTGNVPFPRLSNNEVKKVVLSGVCPEIPGGCPYMLKTLLESCWTLEASTRPSFGDICEELRDLKCSHLLTNWNFSMSSYSSIDIRTIDELLLELKSPILEVQHRAAYGLWLQAKKSDDHCAFIRDGEAVPLLLVMYYSSDKITREHAFGVLQSLFPDYIEKYLGLSCSSGARGPKLSEEDYLRSAIGLVVKILRVSRRVGRWKARESAAAALAKIPWEVGRHADCWWSDSESAISALISLLLDGTTQVKENAAMSFFVFKMDTPSAARVVEAGIVPPLLNVVAKHSGPMVEKALLTMRSVVLTEPKCCIAIREADGAPILVRVLSAPESNTCKLFAVRILCELCKQDGAFVEEVRDANAVKSLMEWTSGTNFGLDHSVDGLDVGLLLDILLGHYLM